jgi:hypothetical protein
MMVMGVWGAGNFDRDDARERLDDIIFKLIDEIEYEFSQLDDPEAFLDMVGDDLVIPNIDICITLTEKYNATYIDTAQAKRWRETYMKAFDAGSTIYSKRFEAERRQVVIETFDRLDRVARDYSEYTKPSETE